MRQIPEHEFERHFWSGVKIGPGCWEWKRDKCQGYGRVQHEKKGRKAHRVAFFLVFGRWPKDRALHSCDNRACVRPSHIFEGSDADNVADMVAKGRHARGSRKAQARLSDEDVRLIRMIGRSLSQRAIAKLFGVHNSVVCRVLNGDAWRHV